MLSSFTMASVPASVLVGVVVAGLAGCSESKAPTGRGDDLKVDVDASAVSPPADDGDDASTQDSPFAPVDGPYGPLPDGYSPLAVCAQCACDGSTFCYGGSPSTSFSGACDQTANAALGVGCHAIPAGCAAEPDCVCLLQALGTQMPCYAACADESNGGFTIFCAP
jgi:hypothetical protein